MKVAKDMYVVYDDVKCKVMSLSDDNTEALLNCKDIDFVLKVPLSICNVITKQEYEKD